MRVDILLSIDQFIFGIDCGCASAGWRLHEDSHAPRQSRFQVMPLSARPCSSAANARRVKIGVWRSATEHADTGQRWLGPSAHRPDRRTPGKGDEGAPLHCTPRCPGLQFSMQVIKTEIVTLRNTKRLICPAVRPAHSRHLQSQHRTDYKTGVHSCGKP